METLVRIVLLLMTLIYIVLGISRYDVRNPSLSLFAFAVAIVCFVVLCFLVRKDK